MTKKVVTRFFNYVACETTSNEKSQEIPSTPGQMKLAHLLADELKALGLQTVSISEFGYVTGTLPSNTLEKLPSIGFIAHLDTSPDASGANVSPRIVAGYDGNDIVLDDASNTVLSPKDFPELIKYKGQDIIVTDGKTLLGADDKAGIAEIMTALETLIANPDRKHGDIRVAFTPDEEIGSGAAHLDIEKFGADWAYTIDGGEIGELEYENFNAASATLTLAGRNVHPGYAKDKMINSMRIAAQCIDLLPKNETPETTEGYEGFFHLTSIEGTVEQTVITYIIRDHDRAHFEQRKKTLQEVVEKINAQYPHCATLEMHDQYYNMREKIEPVMHVVTIAEEAMKDAGVTPKVNPIRGGTDGAQLSFRGLPCPNIFTGGHNFHGRFEYIPIQSMEKAVEVILKIVEKVSK